MTPRRVMTVLSWMAAATLFVLALPGCGGPSDPEVTITSINTNPATIAAGSVIQLSASITASGQNVNSLTKNWTVTAGSVTQQQPDFSLLLRQTAHSASALQVSTTANTVYWLTPTTSGSVTITLEVEEVTKTMNVTVGASPVTLSVADGANSTKVCTIAAHSVTDLYQAAFRVNFSSGWEPVSATQGSFLGAATETLWIGLTNQNGFVPMAITRRGSAAGIDGSGTLATVTFKPSSSASAVRETSDVPFELGMIILRNSHDQLIQTD